MLTVMLASFFHRVEKSDEKKLCAKRERSALCVNTFDMKMSTEEACIVSAEKLF